MFGKDIPTVPVKIALNAEIFVEGKKVGTMKDCSFILKSSKTTTVDIDLVNFNYNLQQLFSDNSIKLSDADFSRRFTAFSIYQMIDSILKNQNPLKAGRPTSDIEAQKQYIEFLQRLVSENYKSTKAKKEYQREIKIKVQPANFYTSTIFANNTAIGMMSPSSEDVAKIEKFIEKEVPYKLAPTDIDAAFSGMNVPFSSIADFKSAYDSQSDNSKWAPIFRQSGLISSDQILKSAFLSKFDPSLHKTVFKDIKALKLKSKSPRATSLTEDAIKQMKIYLVVDLKPLSEMYSSLGITTINLADFSPVSFNYRNAAGMTVKFTNPIPNNPINILYPYEKQVHVETKFTVKDLAREDFSEMIANRMFQTKGGLFGAKNMIQLMNRLKNVFDGVNKRNSLQDIKTTIESETIQRGYYSVSDALKAGLSKLLG